MWHFRLECTRPDPSYFWIPPHIDDRVLTSLAGWVEVIHERNQSGAVPFSINYTGRYFSESGDLIRGELGEGLTCATFVLAVFSDFSLPLVDVTTWRGRLSDKSWHKKILKDMKKYGADPMHVKRQEPLIGLAARYRPEEVAAAFGIFTGLPNSFRDVEPYAQQILGKIEINAA